MELAEERHERGNALPRVLSSASGFLLVLGGYFVLQILLRLITSNTADLDESEQLLATQQLQWGYGPQPPLYTWLLFPLVKMLGLGIFPLALLKNALLFGVYAFTFASSRLIFPDPARRIAATLSLLFLPQIAWEAQRDLTHSILVTLMAVASFYVCLRLRQQRQWRLYLILGLCIGAGVLSKYSFVVFVAGLLIAGAAVRSFRPVFLHPGILLSLAVCALVIAPHLIWAVHHTDWVAATATKFKIAATLSWWKSVLLGMKNFLVAAGSHLGPLLAIYFVFGWKRSIPPIAKSPDREAARFIGTALLGMLVILAGGILFFKVTGFRDRWFMPLCVWVPLFLMAVFSPGLGLGRIKGLIGLAGTVAIVVTFAIPARVWLARVWTVRQTLNASYDELAVGIQRESRTNDFILAGDNWVGGNLKLKFHDSFISSPRVFLESPARSGAAALMVWDATKKNAVTERFFNFAGQVAEFDTNNARYVEAPLKFWPERSFRLGVMPCTLKAGVAAVPEEESAESP